MSETKTLTAECLSKGLERFRGTRVVEEQTEFEI